MGRLNPPQGERFSAMSAMSAGTAQARRIRGGIPRRGIDGGCRLPWQSLAQQGCSLPEAIDAMTCAHVHYNVSHVASSNACNISRR